LPVLLKLLVVCYSSLSFLISGAELQSNKANKNHQPE
jgi:hypothetical protein